jgi:DNA mismatch endonuclease, patch repair protein
MKATARRDTKPELDLRRALHARGRRYKVDAQVVPGLRRRADMVFVAARVAVFVDGCFWHSCPEHATKPRSNAEWWRQKLQANRVRDDDTDRRLAECGWLPIRIWAHEDPESAADQVEQVLVRRNGAQER